MNVKKGKWLVVLVAVAMLMALVPAIGGAQNDIEANYGFIPNSGEASVSKVYLGPDGTLIDEVARYNTYEEPAEYALDKYRVARLAIDSGGNAWALNTMTGQSFPGYASAQGSVARINAEDIGDDTVTIFNLGEPGDGPRTINIVEDNGTVYLWIGFYLGNYFELYEYDANAGTLEPVEDMKIEVGNYTPYYAALDDNGIMWVSSRNASPFPSPVGTPGVFKFDTNELTAGLTALEYSFAGQNNPYAITVASDGKVWVSDGGDWGNTRERFFAVYDSDGAVEYVSVGTGSQAMRGFVEYEGDIWATAINGRVLKGTFDGTVWTFNPVLTGLGELTGIGPDAFGYLWVVRLGANEIYRFDPDNISNSLSVAVGSQPYAYDNFIVPAVPVYYDICGFKYLAVWDGEDFECEEGLEGWTMKLYVWDGTEFVSYLDEDGEQVTATTDAYGKYCFTDLPAGTYRIYEELQDGYQQISPAEYYEVIVPTGQTVDETGPFYNFCNEKERCETAWATEVDEYGDPTSNENWDLPGTGNAWGWNIGPLAEEEAVDFELWAAAGQNILGNGVQVGEGRIVYDEGQVCVYFTLYDGFRFEDVHLWVGETNLPPTRRGYTAAPGQFNFNDVAAWGFEGGEYSICLDDFEGDVYVALHLDVCWFPSDVAENSNGPE